MPIYEYLCEDCGKITETLQKMSEPPPKTCGECGGKHIAKLVSRSAFQLKGGGWYSDLYSSSKKPEAKGKDGEAPAAAKKGGESGEKSAEKAAKESPATAAKSDGAAKPSGAKSAGAAKADSAGK